VEEALEGALATAVEASLEVLLADAGITLSSGPQCDANLSLDTSGRSASGTVDCTGTTSAGLKLTAVFSGTVSAAGTCEGEIVVRVGGRTVLEQPVDECSVDVSLP
jgi:hypothetical protein